MVTVFIPEYVVGHWWEQVLHNQSALRLKGRLLFMPNVMVTSVPWQLNSSERLQACSRVPRPATPVGESSIEPRQSHPAGRISLRGTDLVTGAPPTAAAAWPTTKAAWCSSATRCRVSGCGYGHRRPRVYWHAEVVEVIEPAADRIASLCPIAGVDGAGCCDLAFAAPEAARALKAQVVANQLERLGGHRGGGPNRCRTSARVGAPGSGSMWAPTVAPAFTGITATSW